MNENRPRGVLYIIACGSSSAFLTQNLVIQAQAAGWDVCVITTPSGRKFLNMPQLAQLSGHPVRSEYKQPDEPDLLPRADAIIVFPASFNTLNKWALGISDTLAVGLLSEYTGLKKPIVAVPCFKT
ncbi:MAG: flavoprotein, partial [Ktedonobacteraceae bacterium]|nr:flavoprotein [Ktedonobacteraceae bacterium]